MSILVQARADLDARIKFGFDLVASLQIQNDLTSVTLDQRTWLHHRLRSVPVTMGAQNLQIDVVNLIALGEYRVAYRVLCQMVPDDMTETFHFFTQARIDMLKGAVQQYDPTVVP